MTNFKHPALKELTDQQVRFAPPARRLEQLRRAERLLAEIDPDKQYPYQFVCFRITDYRPDAYPDLLIPGYGVGCTTWACSSPSWPVRCRPCRSRQVAEPVLTLEEISKKLNVTHQDDQPLAQARPDRPAGPVQRPAPGGLPAVAGRPVPGRQPGARREAAAVSRS